VDRRIAYFLAAGHAKSRTKTGILPAETANISYEFKAISATMI
jgi:hypothetical protein